MESSILDPDPPGPELAPPRRWRYAPAIWIAGAALFAYSIAIGLGGGIDFTIAGIRVRSRTWQRPALIGLICIAVVAVVDRRYAWGAAGRIARHVWAGWSMLVAAVSPRTIALAAALWTIVAGLAFGTFIAGGADSSGYLNQARLFARGRLVDELRTAARPPLPDVGYKLAPLGYRPAPGQTRFSPTYPPGYPLLMAPGFAIDERLAHLIVPLSGMMAIWLTFALGRRLEVPVAGATAALLLAVSPTFLYQLVQPMSDVPVTVAWLFALYLSQRAGMAGAALSGVAAGIAILIRPNLLPLAALTCGGCALSAPHARLRRVAASALPVLLALLALGSIQFARYGSPFASGYGRMEDLFSWSNVWPNLERYPRWMFETHTPLIALFIVSPAWFLRRRQQRRSLLLLWAFASAVVAAYLPYVYFQTFEWTYTRFLLPAIPIMWLLVASAIDLYARRLSSPARAAIVAPLVILVAGFCLYVTKARDVFDLRFGERKYVEAANYVRNALPPNAILICMQHSGSLWFYTSRPILRWDQVDPRQLGDVLRWAADHAYTPFLIVDREEYDRIIERFQPRARAELDRLRRRAQFGDAMILGFEPQR
jgi:hypothetical protein